MKIYKLRMPLYMAAICFALAPANASENLNYKYDNNSGIAQVRLSVSDMDFASDEGLSRALSSIKAASFKVCWDTKPESAFSRNSVANCYRENISSSLNAIDDERLTSYYEEQRKFRGEDRIVAFLKDLRPE